MVASALAPSSQPHSISTRQNLRLLHERSLAMRTLRLSCVTASRRYQFLRD
jgi:hypothetical protein